MITKTVNLDSSYEDLFDEIRAASKGRIDIHNLEEFYGNIEDIAVLDSKFLRLPLDEPLFNIDANTRKIEIPVDFRTNGISVQRDHLAEVIFFRIARYFDYTDLSTCKIVINWKMGDREGSTTRFIKFETVITEPDETKSDCIIFGWPINNIVTEKSGTLSFAVEFYKTEDDTPDGEVIYRFNTLAASINIKDGLVISEDVEKAYLDDDIIRSLINSSFGSGDAAVGNARWLTGNGHGLVTGAAVNGPGGTIISFNPNEWQDTLNLRTFIDNVGEPHSVSTNLIAQAFVDDQTEIRYTDNYGDKVEAVMVKLDTAANLNEDLIYYVQLADTDPVAYRKATDEELAAWGTEEQVDLYSKIASITIDTAGLYMMKAQGEKYITVTKDDVENQYTEAYAALIEAGVAEENIPEELLEKIEESKTVTQKIGAGNIKASDIITVPEAIGPSNIVIKGVPLDENIELSADVDDSIPLGEGYSIDPEIQNVIFMDGDSRDIFAVADFDNLGAAKYVWQKGVLHDGQLSFTDISNLDFPFTTDTISVLEGDREGDDKGEGYYRVVVTNFINNTMSEPTPSNTYILSKLASPIEDANVQYYHSMQNIWLNIGVGIPEFKPGRSVTLRASNVEVGENIGSLVYEWYYAPTLESGEQNGWSQVFQTAADKDPEVISVNVEGWYKPIIKNVYNGSIYTKELAPFYVNQQI